VPLIDQVRKMDARIQTLEGQADRFVTSEKKDLIIDSYVKWKIEDFSKYYLATSGGNKIQAEDLLKRKINNGLRSEIGNRTIKDIVSGERSTVMEDALMKMARSSSSASRWWMCVSSRSTCRWKFPAPSISGCVPSGLR
jgi:membrane protease subunit HflC